MVKIKWEKDLVQFMLKSNKEGDEQMKKIVKAVFKLPVEIVDEVITKYIKQCKMKHAIAFMQWRLLYSMSKSEP